jgi:hypothetical protein
MSARRGSEVKEVHRNPAVVTVGWRPVPMAGDVLVSRPTARARRYAISVIPSPGDVLVIRQAPAFEQARELARALAVDVWYTCDHTHFVRIARHRT